MPVEVTRSQVNLFEKCSLHVQKLGNVNQHLNLGDLGEWNLQARPNPPGRMKIASRTSGLIHASKMLLLLIEARYPHVEK